MSPVISVQQAEIKLPKTGSQSLSTLLGDSQVASRQTAHFAKEEVEVVGDIAEVLHSVVTPQANTAEIEINENNSHLTDSMMVIVVAEEVLGSDGQQPSSERQANFATD